MNYVTDPLIFYHNIYFFNSNYSRRWNKDKKLLFRFLSNTKSNCIARNLCGPDDIWNWFPAVVVVWVSPKAEEKVWWGLHSIGSFWMSRKIPMEKISKKKIKVDVVIKQSNEERWWRGDAPDTPYLCSCLSCKRLMTTLTLVSSSEIFSMFTQ